MAELLESAELLAFTTVVETASISRAAAELRVPRATIGRRLARLEERLNVRLLKRSTRTLALTDAGEALYHHARLALEAVREAERSVSGAGGAVRGDLRVSMPPIQVPSFFAALNGFVLRHPEVRLSLHFSTQHVDLRRGGYDVAIRGASELEPGLVARMLARTTIIAVASPVYLAGAPPLRRMSDLRHHRCLSSFAKGELPNLYWGNAKGQKVKVDARVASNDIRYLCQAAIDGAGVAFLPYAQVRKAIEVGVLRQVLAGQLEGESKLAIVYPEREFLPASVRAFVEAIAAWVKAIEADELWPQPYLPESASGRKRQRARKARVVEKK